MKTILEKHYPNSYLVLPSAQSKKTIQARSTGSALKSALKNAKRRHKPSKLHYVDPAKTLQLDRKTCCTKQWKTCKACQLKISVDAFCERNVGKYGCLKSDAAIKEEDEKHDKREREEQGKRLQKMDRQVEESKKKTIRTKEEKTKRGKRHQQLMKRRGEQSKKEQTKWVAAEQIRKKQAEEQEKRDEENEKKVEEQAAKGREADFKSFRKHVEYKKEQIAKEQEAKRKAEQDAKDRQPGHCTILNSAGGGHSASLKRVNQPAKEYLGEK